MNQAVEEVMPRLQSVDPLFITPLLRYQVEEWESLNPVLIAESRAWRDQESGIVRSNLKGWHSPPTLFGRQEPGFRRLCHHIMMAVADATTRFVTAEPENLSMNCDGWVNINPKHAFNGPHDHPGCFWSGVYYVNTPGSEGIPEQGAGPEIRRKDGAIEFLDPRTNVRAVAPLKSTIGLQAVITPRPGLMLLFPSFVQHWVHPNEQDEERISIAFNARIRDAGEKRRLGAT